MPIFVKGSALAKPKPKAKVKSKAKKAKQESQTQQTRQARQPQRGDNESQDKDVDKEKKAKEKDKEKPHDFYVLSFLPLLYPPKANDQWSYDWHTNVLTLKGDKSKSSIRSGCTSVTLSLRCPFVNFDIYGFEGCLQSRAPIKYMSKHLHVPLINKADVAAAAVAVNPDSTHINQGDGGAKFVTQHQPIQTWESNASISSPIRANVIMDALVFYIPDEAFLPGSDTVQIREFCVVYSQHQLTALREELLRRALHAKVPNYVWRRLQPQEQQILNPLLSFSGSADGKGIDVFYHPRTSASTNNESQAQHETEFVQLLSRSLTNPNLMWNDPNGNDTLPTFAYSKHDGEAVTETKVVSPNAAADVVPNAVPNGSADVDDLKYAKEMDAITNRTKALAIKDEREILFGPWKPKPEPKPTQSVTSVGRPSSRKSIFEASKPQIPRLLKATTSQTLPIDFVPLCGVTLVDLIHVNMCHDAYMKLRARPRLQLLWHWLNILVEHKWIFRDKADTNTNTQGIAKAFEHHSRVLPALTLLYILLRQPFLQTSDWIDSSSKSSHKIPWFEFHGFLECDPTLYQRSNNPELVFLSTETTVYETLWHPDYVPRDLDIPIAQLVKIWRLIYVSLGMALTPSIKSSKVIGIPPSNMRMYYLHPQLVATPHTCNPIGWSVRTALEQQKDGKVVVKDLDAEKTVETKADALSVAVPSIATRGFTLQVYDYSDEERPSNKQHQIVPPLSLNHLWQVDAIPPPFPIRELALRRMGILECKCLWCTEDRNLQTQIQDLEKMSFWGHLSSDVSFSIHNLFLSDYAPDGKLEQAREGCARMVERMTTIMRRAEFIVQTCTSEHDRGRLTWMMRNCSQFFRYVRTFMFIDDHLGVKTAFARFSGSSNMWFSLYLYELRMQPFQIRETHKDDDEFVQVLSRLPIKYRATANFLWATSIENYIRNFVDLVNVHKRKMATVVQEKMAQSQNATATNSSKSSFPTSEEKSETKTNTKTTTKKLQKSKKYNNQKTMRLVSALTVD